MPKYELDNKETVWAWRDRILEKSRITFFDLKEVAEYIQSVNNPSRLAFRRGDAETFIDEMSEYKVDGYFEPAMKALVTRIKICEQQGDFSLSQKRLKAAQRAQASGGIHPAPEEFTAEQVADTPVLRFFHYKHLPERLRGISKQYFELAKFTFENCPRNAERTKALNKLLEAKDCAVRTLVE